MKKGQSILEVIIALGVFALMSAAVVSMLVGGVVALGQGGDRTEATALARDALEIVRSIRDGAWNEFIYPTAQLTLSGGQWVLVSSPNPQQIGKYFRAITFSNICRNASRDIVVCGSGGDTPDVHSTEVAVTVSWETRPGITNTVSERMYLTNWDSREWTEDTTAHFADGTFTNTVSSGTAGDGDGAVLLQQQ